MKVAPFSGFSRNLFSAPSGPPDFSVLRFLVEVEPILHRIGTPPVATRGFLLAFSYPTCNDGMKLAKNLAVSH